MPRVFHADIIREQEKVFQRKQVYCNLQSQGPARELNPYSLSNTDKVLRSNGKSFEGLQCYYREEAKGEWKIDSLCESKSINEDI